MEHYKKKDTWNFIIIIIFLLYMISILNENVVIPKYY